ncbi:MAG: sulfotransferase, partial [Cetobacterium sp.]
MIKLVSCTGYHGTGSSIISDLLKEYADCSSYGDYEFRFIQDPFGISDLEFNLIENNHRLNTGYAIRNFLKMTKKLSKIYLIKRYEKYFDGNFEKETEKYIKSLECLEWRGSWHQEIIDRGNFYFIIDSLKLKIFSIIRKKINKLRKKNFEQANILNKRYKMYYSNISKEKFYTETKKYTTNLINYLDKEDKKILILDQLVPPSNLKRYINYFENIKIIVVDRDPRDCYILNKIFWRDGVVPVENIDLYIEWYKKIREHLKNEEDPKNIMRIKFEDAVLNYENTLCKIEGFLNLNKN